MNFKKRYFVLQLKNAFKLFPQIFAITCAVFLSIALAGGLLMAKRADDSNKQKISIGIVGNLENTYFDIGILALQEFDDSRFYVDIQEYNKEDAISALQSREISGFLLIPDNYIEGIYYGDNIPAKYITLNSPEGFGTIISNEVATMVSDMVTKSQSGMYSMQELARKHGIKTSKHTQNLMFSYVDLILNRSKIYKLSSLGVSDELSLGGYYICAFIVFFLLLWSISCNRFFSQRKLSFSRILETRKITSSTQIMCEYASYLAMAAAAVIIFAIFFGFAVQFADLNIKETMGLQISSSILFAIACLPAIAVITLFQYTLYELIGGTVSSLLCQFVLAIGLGYICGCFYPSSYFPESIQIFGKYTPIGISFSYIRKIMSGKLPASEILISAVYSIGFFAISSVLRYFKIKGVRND